MGWTTVHGNWDVRSHRGPGIRHLSHMRKLLSLLLFASASLAHAQRNDQPMHTLFSAPADSITGGYVSMTGRAFTAMKQDAFLLGGRVGMTVGHRLTFGLAGYGLCGSLRNAAYNEYRIDNGRSAPDGLALRMGYGGLFVEPTIFPRSVVHFSVPVTVGAGGVAYGYPVQDGRYSHTAHTDSQVFYFVEPAVDAEVNVLRNVRLCVGASYFYTSNIRLPRTDQGALRRPMFNVTLKVGTF